MSSYLNPFYYLMGYDHPEIATECCIADEKQVRLRHLLMKQIRDSDLKLFKVVDRQTKPKKRSKPRKNKMSRVI